MKLLILVFFLSVPAEIPELNEVRQDYKKAIVSEKEADDLFAKLKSADVTSPVMLAYRGATQAVLAKHRTNPYTKLALVKAGSEVLDDAVLLDPNNLEIRYLRYAVESNIPDFLPYKKHVEQDKSRILIGLTRHPESLDSWLQTELAAYMLKNAQIDSEIRVKLEALLH